MSACAAAKNAASATESTTANPSLSSAKTEVRPSRDNARAHPSQSASTATGRGSHASRRCLMAVMSSVVRGMAGFLPGRRSERATTDRRLAWPRGMASTPLIFFVVFPISTRNHSETKCKIFRGIVARGFLARDSLLRGQCAYRAGVSRACRVPEVPRVAHARGLVVVPLRRAVPRAGHRSKPGPNRFEFGPQKVGR